MTCNFGTPFRGERTTPAFGSMAEIHEIEELRNQRRVFTDRFDAGRVLGRMLAPVYGRAADAILLGIPMGGVPVVVKIAEMLKCPWDLAIVRKIQIPGNTEAGFGAMTSDGDILLNEPLIARLGLTDAQIQRQSAKVRTELAKRNQRFRRGSKFPELAGKTVILVDDGLASGFTMKVAILLTKKRRAAGTVVAVPTASRRSLDALEESAGQIYCANIREGLSFAVADAYENWYDLSEAQVLALLPDRWPGEMGS